MNTKTVLTAVASLVASGWLMSSAFATPVTVNGLTFTEVGTDINITGGGGTGTSIGNPIVLNEVLTGVDATISIAGLPNFGEQSNLGYRYGFFLQKVITNSTGQTWNFFDHELQKTLGTASSNSDGLSFAQGLPDARPFTSDVFATVNEIVDPRDFINFSDGLVEDGETVTFNFAITENPENSIDLFYLRQRPNFRVGEVPEPATLALFGVGLLGLGIARWRRRAA